MEDEDEEMEPDEEDDDEGAEDSGDDSGSSEGSVLVDDEEDLDDVEDPELRRKIEEALRVNGVQAATGESDSESEEELMDDEQMLAIDEQLAAVFKARAGEKKLGKGKLTASSALNTSSLSEYPRNRCSKGSHTLQEPCPGPSRGLH